VSTTDPHRYDDAAYILGALSPDEHAAFEAHLTTCFECSARVREIDDIPALLQGIEETDLADEPMPATLLPSLLRAASRQRRRQRLFIGSLAAVAAACAAALIVALWPTSTPAGPAQRAFVPVAASPVSATATLTGKSWGTAIDVHCHYLDSNVDQSWRYALVAYDRSGKPHQLGDWKLPPDKNIDYQAGTSLTPSQITALEITLPDGQPVLKLKT
jgi:hypothetical protein